VSRKYRFVIVLLALGLQAGVPHAQEEGDTAPAVTNAEPEAPVAEAPAESKAAGSTEESAVVKEKGDVLTLPETPAEPAPPMSLPQHGMKMEEVERRFGAPVSRDPAVGQPPITRWNYNGFSVFFEHRTVLHAVQKDRPAEIYRRDELLPAASQ
jgi:hypothetical protein